jgi:hypothetical protein
MRTKLMPLILLVGLTPADASDLQVSSRWETVRWLRQSQAVELDLSRAPLPEEGSLRVFLGTLDVTDLFRLEGTVLRSDPGVAPLPSGQHELVVQLAGPEEWHELARLPVAVLHRGGLERAAVSPTVQLEGAGQLAEGHDPESNAPARATYLDASLRLGVSTEHALEGLTITSEVETLGVTYHEAALRYGELGDDAPRFDLARYRVRLESERLALEVGDISVGEQPQLIEGFGSRGVAAEWRPAGWLELGAAAVNGTRIVGWDNLLGLAESEHRIVTAALAVDVVPSRPGLIGLSAAWVDASVLPLVSFSQGAVTDAETSSGWGVRVQGGDPTRRLQVDAGYSRSTFTNPEDPFLSQGTELVPVEEVTRDARFARATLQAVRGLRLGGEAELALALGYRHERVDPLYRSPTAFARADYVSDRIELNGSAGAVSFTGAYTEGEDNLDDIPSVLTTRTEELDVGLAVPLQRLLAPRSVSAWWPTLSAGNLQVHQYGLGVPVGGGFSPSHVPDQLSDSRFAAVDWQAARWQLGYRWTSLDQDNRQPGREQADFANTAHSVVLGLSPAGGVDLGLEVAVETADNLELMETDETDRLSARLAWQVGGGHSLDLLVSRTTTENDTTGATRRDLVGDGGWSWRLDLGSVGGRPLGGRLWVRYANRQAFSFDPIFFIDDDRLLWTIMAGFNLSWGS